MQKIILSERGKISQFLIVFTTLTLGLFLSGGLISVLKDPPILPDEIDPVAGICCDKGDGDACAPYDDDEHTFTYKGIKYGLLKSGVKFEEGNYHLEESGEKYKGDPIILNTSDGYNPPKLPGQPEHMCNISGGDAIFIAPRSPGVDTATLCYEIANEELVYVCKKNCKVTNDSRGFCKSSPLPGRKPNELVSCYGSPDSIFDVYFKLSSYPSPGIPEPIKNCSKKDLAITPAAGAGKQYLVMPQEQDRVNLHINTFKIVTLPSPVGTVPWYSPFCKPAIYLYPEKTSAVHVQVKPQGKMTLTIPQYPEDGWKVTAHPDGRIEQQSLSTLSTIPYPLSTSYDYLYYEAEIPDSSYKEPNEGYVIPQEEMNNLFLTLLPQLGLNSKETQQFYDYWVPVLPKAKYYFVGIIPQENLDTIAPLSIFPKPDTVIRVSLYFKALDEKIYVPIPTLKPVTRSGFTTVEWGGIFKKDPKHNFSCFM